jgi:hypothetical protein
MSKDLGNLSRLQQKLKSTYGEHDALALQFQREIESRKAFALRYRRRSFPESSHSSARSVNRRQEMLCTYARQSL